MKIKVRAHAVRSLVSIALGYFKRDQLFATAEHHYLSFRKRDNRFSWVGLHGETGNLFMSSYDRGLKALDRSEWFSAFSSDTKRAAIRAALAVVRGRW